MILRIRVGFLDGSYDALSGEEGEAEWPPHPYRILAALRAGAAYRLRSGRVDEDAAAADLRALGWLERTPPPIIWAPLKSELGEWNRSTFVPELPSFGTVHDGPGTYLKPVDAPRITNRALQPSATSFDNDRPITTNRSALRKAGMRIPGTHPAVYLDVAADDADLSAHVEALRACAREITYLGQSTSTVVITLEQLERPKPPLPGPGEAALRRHAPGRHGRHQIVVTGWAEGTLDALERKYRDEGGAGTSGRVYAPAIGYRLTADSPGREQREWLVYEPTTQIRQRHFWRYERWVAEFAGSHDVEFELIVNAGNRFANGRAAVVFRPAPGSVRDAFPDSGELVPVPDAGGWQQRRTWTGAARVWATVVPARFASRERDDAAVEARDAVVDLASGLGHRELVIEQLTVRHTPLVRGAVALAAPSAWHVAFQLSEAIDADEPLRLASRWRSGEVVGGQLIPLDRQASQHGQERR